MSGALNVLNVGAGDIALSFNHLDEDEAKKAIQVLTDMQARGYAILVTTEDGQYVRAQAIDASRGRYIVKLPDGAPLPPGAEELDIELTAAPRRGRPRKVGVPINRASATGVARSAGG